MSTVYLSLGSNMGDRAAHLQAAVTCIRAVPEIRNVRLSSLYETAPVGNTQQEAFLNMVVALETHFEPLELLRAVQHIENQLGRTREVRWGPRTIDIDVIAFDEIELDSDDLILPHPRAKERAFVLVPLLELDPEARIGSETAASLLGRIRTEADQSVVRLPTTIT